MLTRAQLKRLFEVTLVVKGVAAVFDLAAAAVIVATGSERVAEFFARATSYMTHFDQDNMVSQYLLAHSTVNHGSVMFIAGYLFFHGIVNVVLVEGIWFKRTWAFHRAIRIMLFFLAYQTLRLVFVFSYWLLAVTLYDILVIILMYNEYLHSHKKHLEL